MTIEELLKENQKLKNENEDLKEFDHQREEMLHQKYISSINALVEDNNSKLERIHELEEALNNACDKLSKCIEEDFSIKDWIEDWKKWAMPNG